MRWPSGSNKWRRPSPSLTKPSTTNGTAPTASPRTSLIWPSELSTRLMTCRMLNGRRKSTSSLTIRNPSLHNGVFAAFPLDPHSGEPASPSDSERVRPFFTSLLSLSFSPSPLSSLVVEALGAISRSFGDRQCCAWAWGHHRVSLVCPHRASCFRLKPQPWIPLLTMSITGHRQREQEYGYLSYFHHAR